MNFDPVNAALPIKPISFGYSLVTRQSETVLYMSTPNCSVCFSSYPSHDAESRQSRCFAFLFLVDHLFRRFGFAGV